LGSSYESFKNLLTGHHSISSATATSSVPSKDYEYIDDVRRLRAAEESGREGNLILVDVDLFNTYELDFLSKSEIPENLSNWKYAVINEEAIEVFGFSSPEEALGEELVFSSYQVKIVGVVKNVHWSSLKEASPPTLFILDDEYGVYFSIKTNLSDIPATLAHIESAYKSVFPEDPFEFFFLDDSFNRQYQSDLQFQNLFLAFSILAILIACLGLFALVSFSATLKVKEIGVRKILGASVGNLMLQLSSEYIVLLGCAVILAIPIFVLGASSWLENYAYRIDIGLELILIPVLILFLIALATVSYRTYVASNANPVTSLRAE
jgi:putative ABC transport system permease protein